MLGFGLKSIFDTASRNPTIKIGQMWHESNHLALAALVCFRGPEIYFAKFWYLFKKTSDIKCKKADLYVCSKGLGMVASGRVRGVDTKLVR